MSLSTSSFHARKARRFLQLRVRVLGMARCLLAMAALAAMPGWAATTSVGLLLDTDNQLATGCAVTVGATTTTGIDTVVTASVVTSTTGATVTGVSSASCVGSVMGAPQVLAGGSWPVGLGHGSAASAVVELAIPLAQLPPGATLRAVVFTDNGAGGTDTTSAFLITLRTAGPGVPASIPVPLSPWLALGLGIAMLAALHVLRRRYPGQFTLLVFALIVTASGVAWAASVLLDGNVEDWRGVPAAVSDATGDGGDNADIVAAYTQQDARNLYVRIDADIHADGPANVAPVVSAGAPQSITFPSTANLAGTATDDGLPNPPGALTLAWTKVSGPGSVTFGTAAAASTTATFSGAGVYVLQLAANDGAAISSAQTTVTVNVGGGANAGPVVNAGADQTVVQPAAAVLVGTATDDGLPAPPAALTLHWSLVSGPGGAVAFYNDAATTTSATFGAPGTYVLRLAASDGALSASSTVTVTVQSGAPTLAAIADRTIIAGDHLQIPLVAADYGTPGALSYALTTAPGGAALAPPPVVDWTPTIAQLGPHTFTATVTNALAQSASVTFHVMVTAPVNHPPKLAPQASLSLNAATAFTRTLTASDPDGDTLNYLLVNGPPGMSLAGHILTWPAGVVLAGEYSVTVRVTDTGGLYDQQAFALSVRTPAAPAAADDEYTAHVGVTLTVPASGVLANDTTASGAALSASLRTDPDKGTLTAFAADGGFTYAPPLALASGVSLQPQALWGALLYDNTGFGLAADINHDGGADLITSTFGTPIAFDGKTGTTLWNGWDTSSTSLGQNCRGYLFSTDFALGDVDGSGDITLVIGTNCDGSTDAGSSTRLMAVDATPANAVAGHARVKWLSERLDEKLPVPPSVGAEPVDTYVLSVGSGLASFATPTLARLVPQGGVKVLTRFLLNSGMGIYDSDGDGVRDKYAACRVATGKVEDEGKACKVTFIVDAATGVKEAALTAPNPFNESEAGQRIPMRETAPVVADLDGDGQVEIVSGGDVFHYVAGEWTLAWQAAYAPTTHLYDPIAVAVADLDGDGTAEVVLEAGWLEDGAWKNGFLVYRHDGVLVHGFSVPTSELGLLSIADVDGDGMPEIVFTARGLVYAYRPDGTLLWATLVPDDNLADFPDDDPTVAHWPAPVYARSTAGQSAQVYDLDLDGSPEVIVAASNRLVIIDGRTGRVKSSAHNNGHSSNSTLPLVVDANGDGHADIIDAAGNPSQCSNCPMSNMLAFTGTGAGWAPVAKTFNQLSYNAWAINDAGAIAYDGAVHRSYRQQRQLGTVVDPRTIDTATFTYAAVDEGAESTSATVRIRILPPNNAPVITSIPPTAILDVAQPPDNTYPTFVYQVAAYDPDAGDTVHYELVYSTVNTYYFPQATVDATTGVMRMFMGPCGGGGCLGVMTFVVAAVDNHGARTEQAFIFDMNASRRTVPDVEGDAVDDAKVAILAVQLFPRVSLVFATQPVGTVVAQAPAAGTTVARSETVVLSVSKGPQPVAMPSVVGKQIIDAAAQLGVAGIDFTVDPIASSSIPSGQVMSQAPLFGTLVLPGVDDPAILGVSIGPPLGKPVASIVVTPGETTRLVADKLAYRATAVFTDGTSSDVTLRAAWSSTAGAVASVDVTGMVKALTAGDTLIRATLSGKTGGTPLHVLTQVGDVTDPTALITSPVDDATLYGRTVVVGTANDTHFLRYELAYAPADSGEWIAISEGAVPVIDGALGSFDPTVLLNDQYTLRLRVFDRDGKLSEAQVTVQAAGARKVGLFSITIKDLTVPLGTLPIGIQRTYDSRDKRSADFGVGWHLSLETLRVRANRVLGTGWRKSVSGPTVSIAPTSPHKVTLTLADGRVEEFDMVIAPTSNIGSLDATHVAGFVPRPGTQGTLTAVANSDLLIINDGPNDVLVDDDTLEPYSPVLYRYTSAAGTTIDVSPVDGVHAIVDANGQTLTFDRDGITHSNGRKVTYTRDAEDRIVAVTDPAGRTATYAYDGNGDLTVATDPAGAASTYSYDRNHGLLTIVDATGRQLTRNEYDESGRIIAVTDAAGNTLTFSHDDDAQTDVLTDRRGHVTRVTYDEQGNVITRQRTVTIDGTPTIASESAVFDSLGNQTSGIDPDGRAYAATFDGPRGLSRVVDPAGLALTSTYAYVGSTPRVTHAVDPSGRTFDFDYDAQGNVIGYATPLSGDTTNTISPSGQISASVDALGNTVTSTYDGDGRVTRQDVRNAANTLLRRIDKNYDAAGNLTAQTLLRTDEGLPNLLTTRFAYDAAGRLMAITDPAGGVTRNEYDAAGRLTARIDPLGRRTTYTFDALGRQARVDYADGTHDSITYDANGNVVTQTDRAGRTLSHGYDELDRRVSTTYPDGSSTHVVLSAGGYTLATIDPSGYRTDFTYDNAGRLLTTTMPAVQDGGVGPVVRPVNTRILNRNGQVTTATDAAGRATHYAYDGNGRLVTTTFADGSSLTQSYDALGRRTGIVDEDGHATQFALDALGRLVGVSGYAGDIAYAHDEAGNVVSETDALGHITRYRYDALNRLVEKRYPGGGSEHYAFDVAGNLAASTDGNGKVTSFTYDAMDRVVRRDQPDGTVDTFTYAADGQRQSAVSAAGTTTYSYDMRGLLTTITLPGGSTVARTRDAAGNLATLTTPSGTTSYSYDALGRLIGASSASGSASIAYDLAGNVVGRSLPNGSVAQYERDARGRVTSLSYSNGGTTIASYANQYTSAGRRSRVVELDGSDTRYTYDGRGRLSAETRTGTSAHAATYAYDAVGNRVSSTINGETTVATYDSDDRLLVFGSDTFAYDAAGRRTSRSGPVPATFSYNGAGRLASAVVGGNAQQYGYDSDGNRNRVSDPLRTTRMIVDATNPTGFAQVLEEQSGVDLTRYVYLDRLVTRTDAAGSQSYVHDERGDVRALLAGNSVTDTYTYDAWGKSLATSGGTSNPYRYRGEWLDEGSGLYSLRARDYDANAGRFLTRDPYGGSLDEPISRHRYLYANDDPVNHSDPSGLEAETLAELQVTQMIESQLSLTDTFAKVRAACTVKSTLDQVNELMFWSGAGLQLATSLAASSFSFAFDTPGFAKTTAGLSTSVPLVNISRENAPEGMAEKVSFGLSYGGGKVGMSGAMKFKGKPGFSLGLSAPPPEIKASAGITGASATLAEFNQCGIKTGVIEMAANLKLYSGFGAGSGGGSGISVGGSGTLDLTLSLFNGHFSTGITLMGMDASTKGVTIYVGGVGLTL